MPNQVLMMHVVRFFCSITLALSASSQSENFRPPEYEILNFRGLAIKYGHTPEQYDVITEDGYILTLFHIPGRSPLPVLLIHGILDSAETWLLRGEDSLGITLVKAGYDVWFGNTRGNRYSRRHITLNPDKDVAFWQYSFNEIGCFDLGAIIDRVLNLTGAPTLSAIAHSQGTTAFYVLGSRRPEYNSKVNVMISLAPVCYLHHSPPPIATFIALAPVVDDFLTKYKIYEIFGDNSTNTHILRDICTSPIFGYTVCGYGILFPFGGKDPIELEPEFFQVMALHFPAGVSTKSFIHYLQVGRRKTFAPYDYGADGNKIVYNSPVPPPYDLGNVTLPIALLANRNDPLSTLPDVELLRQQLRNVVYYAINPRAITNHIDVVWGRNMWIYLFPYIFRLLRKYNGFIN